MPPLPKSTKRSTRPDASSLGYPLVGDWGGIRFLLKQRQRQHRGALIPESPLVAKDPGQAPIGPGQVYEMLGEIENRTTLSV